LAAIAVVIRPLFAVLTELCGGRERAQFWTAYACVLTLATPLLVVSTPGLLDAAAARLDSGAVLQRAVFYALGGIIVALLITGRSVWKPIARQLALPAQRPGPGAAGTPRPWGDAP
jgi:hypothetical protein